MKNFEIEIAVNVLAETEKALYVDFGGKAPVWVPKSQIKDECEENGKITSIFISEWLANEKGML